MRAVVDQGTCTGCGLCPDICPAVFKMQSETATAYVNPVPPDAVACCRDAAEQCPVAAIGVFD